MKITHEIYYNSIIVLLYQHDTHTAQLISDIISLYSEHKSKMVEKDTKISEFYITILNEIMDLGLTLNNDDSESSKKLNNDTKVMLSKYKTNEIVSEYPVVMQNLLTIIDNSMTTNTVNQLSSRLQNQIIRIKTDNHIKTLYGATNKFDMLADPGEKSTQIDAIRRAAEELSNVVNADHLNVSTLSSGSDVVNLNDKDQLQECLNERDEAFNSENILTTGCVGLNMSLGSPKGFIRGESAVYAALSSNYKTSGLLDTFRWLLMYNEFSHIQNPLLVFISLENNNSYSIYEMLRKIYYFLHKDEPDVDQQMREVDRDTLINTFSNYLKSKKVRVEMHKFNPTRVTFDHETYQRLMLGYSKNYEVVACVLDYLALCSRTNLAHLPNNKAIEYLFRSYSNTNKDLNICGITGHQLNSKASEIKADTIEPTRKFNQIHLADSVDVYREVDKIIFMNLERNIISDKVFVSVHTEKNRNIKDTLESHKYFAYELHPVMGIYDDVHIGFKGHRDLGRLINESKISDACSNTTLF